MAVESDKPVLIFGVINHYQDEKRQDQLRQEKRMVHDLLKKASLDATMRIEITDPDQGVFWRDLVRKNQFDPNVAVLHLAGFAAGDFIHITGGLGEDRYTVVEFAKQIARFPNLQLVMLNGCATPELLVL
ncbi:MAG: hypothetical protein AAFV07_15620, partial [Bacteroidota bacterium]